MRIPHFLSKPGYRKAIIGLELGVFCLAAVVLRGVPGTVFAESGVKTEFPHARVVVANLTPDVQTFLFTSDVPQGGVENGLTVTLEPNRVMVLRFPTAAVKTPKPYVHFGAARNPERNGRELSGFDLIWVPNPLVPSESFASLLNWRSRDPAPAEDEFTPLLDGAGFTAFPGFSAWGVLDWSTRGAVVRTIPVAVYVDEEQTAAPQLWVPRLQRRLEAANEVFRTTCGIEFQIQETGTWQSDDSLKDIEHGLDDFAAKVKPRNAFLAIGYSSQFGAGPTAGHLGVSHGMLAGHLLISDTGVKMGEADHLDVLIHELGHYLGAVHVPSDQSVMFPKTRPDLVRGKRFRVGFDPINTLILNCTAEELLQGRNSAAEFSRETIAVLQAAYRTAASLPQADVTAHQALALVSRADASTASPSPQGNLPATVAAQPDGFDEGPASQAPPPSVEAARSIVRSIMADLAAGSEERGGRGAAPSATPGATDSDARFEWLVRRAAAGALRLPESSRPHAVAGFLIAVGVLTDSTSLLLDQPVVGVVWRSVESRAERARRIALLGRLTIQGREDWAQHFAVSMALVELTGTGPAKSLGLMKEWRDSQGQSGFSFADLAADYAGVRLADALKRNLVTLELVERDFKVADFVPRLAPFPEGITATDLQTRYGGLMGREFSQMLSRIESTIDEAPGWARLQRSPSE